MLLDNQICPSVMSLKTTTCHFSSVAVRIGEGGKVYRRQTFFSFLSPKKQFNPLCF
jgi:hypothetical protein